jgi:hypothetical protein
MHRGMLPVSRAVRRLAPALAAAAVVAVPLLPGAAAAQEPAGRTVVGELVQAWPEAEHGDEAAHDDAAQPLTFVETAAGEAVRIPTGDAAGLEVGSTVEVTVGAPVDDEEGFDPARELLGSQVVRLPEPVPTPQRAVTNQVTVALVAPDGAARDDVRPAQVTVAVDGPVATFWSQQTGGALSLGVTAEHDWVETTAGCGNPTALWNEAAEKVGFRPGPGKHLLLYVSSAAEDCGYGLAEVGSLIGSGGRAYVREVLPSLIAHEFGHNFGLGHSSALYCAEGPETGGCDVAGYRDHYDVMGASWSQVGTLNVVQASKLGVLPPSALRELPADGATTRVTLAPLSGASGVRGVRLTGGGRQYWLELRTPDGQDRWLGTDADRFDLEPGVLVRRAGSWPDTSLLLDPTPTAGREGDLQVALPVGNTVRLAGSFAVTVTGLGSEGATLEIRSSATGTVPETSADDVPAPDVLAGAADPAAGGSDVAAAAPAETSPAPGAVARAQVETAGAQAAAEADQPTASEPRPAVVPAAQTRSLAVPAVAGAALGGSALLVARRLLRTRVRG